MIFVAVDAAGKPLGAYPTMRDAQEAIAAVEPDVLLQGTYKIHPIDSPAAAEAAKLNIIWKLKLEKFDGETGELVETIEREGVN